MKLVKFRIKANPQGQYYFPKEVRQELGNNLEMLCNARAGVIFPEGTSIETVLESLEVIEKDLFTDTNYRKRRINKR